MTHDEAQGLLTHLVINRRLCQHNGTYVGLFQPQERSALLSALDAAGGYVLDEQRANYRLLGVPPVLYWMTVGLGDVPCATSILESKTPTTNFEAWPATPSSAPMESASEEPMAISSSSTLPGSPTSWLAAVFGWLKKWFADWRTQEVR